MALNATIMLKIVTWSEGRVFVKLGGPADLHDHLLAAFAPCPRAVLTSVPHLTRWG